jgi:metal-dependent amidase/aminoacylase/carboxypeptidase family protein
METFVRGKSIEAFVDANAKVDRALKAGAMAIGAKVKITTLPGYMPLIRYQDFWNMYKANAVSLVGEKEYGDVGHMGGSTDMGDLSQIMPAIHPFAGGVSGTSHGSDYLVKDYNTAVIAPAKAMAMTVIDLLADGAVKAKELIKKSKPPMTKKKYLALMDSLLNEEEFQG